MAVTQRRSRALTRSWCRTDKFGGHGWGALPCDAVLFRRHRPLVLWLRRSPPNPTACCSLPGRPRRMRLAMSAGAGRHRSIAGMIGSSWTLLCRALPSIWTLRFADSDTSPLVPGGTSVSPPLTASHLGRPDARLGSVHRPSLGPCPGEPTRREPAMVVDVPGEPGHAIAGSAPTRTSGCRTRPCRRHRRFRVYALHRSDIWAQLHQPRLRFRRCGRRSGARVPACDRGHERLRPARCISLRFCSGMWFRRRWFGLNGRMGIRGQGATSYAVPVPDTTGRVRATRSRLSLFLPQDVSNSQFR